MFAGILSFIIIWNKKADVWLVFVVNAGTWIDMFEVSQCWYIFASVLVENFSKEGPQSQSCECFIYFYHRNVKSQLRYRQVFRYETKIVRRGKVRINRCVEFQMERWNSSSSIKFPSTEYNPLNTECNGSDAYMSHSEAKVINSSFQNFPTFVPNIDHLNL